MTTRLLVGTEKGLFSLESEDRRSWKVAEPEPAHKGWQVYSLYPHTGGEVFAGISSAFFAPHLELSHDGGRSWTPIERSPRFPEGSERELKQVWSVAAGAGEARLLAGVAHAALFESSDGGETWEWNQGLEGHPSRPNWAPGAGGLCLHTIIPDAADPRRLFIGISAVGVFRSDDGGRTWNTKNRGIGTIFDPISEENAPDSVCCVHKFVQDPSRPSTLYQQNHTGVYRTHDAGEKWERIENGLPSGFGFPIVMLPGKPQTLFVVPQEASFSRTFPAGEFGVYRTRDGGDRWERTHRGLEGPNWGGVLRNSMIVDRQDPPAVYVGTSLGDVYCTLDEGDSWQLLPGRFPRVESLASFEV